MIYSIVTMIIKKGKMDEFLAECAKIRPLVLAEKGCLMYDYTREIETGSDRQEPFHPDRITLYQANIERVCTNDDEIRYRIYEVLCHEIGHYFGMNETQIRRAMDSW